LAWVQFDGAGEAVARADEVEVPQFGATFGVKTDGFLVGEPRLDLIETGTEFQVKRHGEDSRFEGSAIRVAANVLRDRVADVLQPVVPLEEARSAVSAAQVFACIVVQGCLFSHPHFEAKPNL
jgi:hypothetical protein